MPIDSQLSLDETFDAQKNLVNDTIIPTVMQTLDLETFPISEFIVYEMIHNRHKHRREEHLRKQQSKELQDKKKRKKHLNSRRNDVSNELSTV